MTTQLQQRQLVPDLDVVVELEGLGDQPVVEHLAARLEARRQQPGERVQEEQREARPGAVPSDDRARASGRADAAAAGRGSRRRGSGRRQPTRRLEPATGSRGR